MRRRHFLGSIGAVGLAAGTKLTQANDRSPMFWFAWAQFYPETGIWGS